MSFIYSIMIDRKSATALYKQLGDGLCTLIENGTLPPNQKLPPIRKMAEALKVNSVTVVAAYRYLEQKKVVYSHVGSGTYVSPVPFEKQEMPITIPPKVQDMPINVLESSINFTASSVPEDFFPVEEFQRAFNEILEKEKGKAFCCLDSQGYPPLLELLSNYLQRFQIKASPQLIQIVSGAQQGIDLTAKALLNYGDNVFVEKPTFYGAAGAFLSRGANLWEIELEKDGMNIKQLEDYLKLYKPKLIYMMSYFQTPTGISYSIEKKRRILELAEQYDAYIVEDDNLYEFYYQNQKLVPLKALDYKNRVIYIKSFSKIFMPGLRIGFLVMPPKLKQKMLTAKYTTDIATSGFLQKAVAHYFTYASWEKHMEQMRQYGAKKYQMTLQMLQQDLKGFVEYTDPGGGVGLWIKLPKEINSRLLCNELLQNNILVSPGEQFFAKEENSQYIRLCFIKVPYEQIHLGLKQIRKTLEACLNKAKVGIDK